MDIIITFGLAFFGYVLGSIPTGYWLVKALKGIDIRTIGSGSTGATNVVRVLGKWWGAVVLLVDAMKGYIPVRLAIATELCINIFPLREFHVIPLVVAIASLVGHSKSLFLGFKGGKSAATGLGTLLALNPGVGFSTFALWVFLVFTTRYVSVASIVAVWLCGVFMFLFHNPVSYVIYCLVGALYVTWRHHENIKRLFAGQEPRIGDRSQNLERLEHNKIG